MALDLDIVVGGRWLAMECLYGDVEISTVWPGGSEELSWSMGTPPAHRFAGGETVAAYYGGAALWAGALLEPDPSQDRTVAAGAYREGEGFAAIDNTGAATTVLDTAIDQAISRGLRWTRPTSIRNTSFAIDVSQGPVTVSAELDMLNDVNGQRWGVDPFRQVYVASDPTVPAYQTLPLPNGAGFALDHYASTLIGRYLDSGTSTYKTVTVTDSTAAAQHQTVEQIVDLTGRGAISSTQATNHLTSLQTLAKAIPTWTAPMEFSYGELLNNGGTPVALEVVQAGQLLRVHGGWDLAQRLNGQMFLDVLIGRTQLNDGVIQVQPLQMAARTLTDVLQAALSKGK